MTNVVPFPEPESPTALTAAELRAKMARVRLTLRTLVAMTGRKYGYWQRRVSGTTPLDVEDLYFLAELFSCEPQDFLPKAASHAPGPDDGGWAPSGSNRRPTDYKGAVQPDATAARVLPFRRSGSPLPAVALDLVA